MRGPLVYSLKIDEDWRKTPHGDWEIFPTTPWNYGIVAEEKTISDHVTFSERPVGDQPFSPEGAPVIATVKGRRVPDWQGENGSALPVPVSPVMSDEPIEELTLIPYGSSNLRITEFPILAKGR